MERTSSHHRAVLHFAATPGLPEHPPAPLRMMVLTSIRDVGTCDKNGTTVRTPEGWRYMEGAVERLIYETREGGALHGLLRIAGIINDDLERDIENIYPHLNRHTTQLPPTAHVSA